MVGDRFSHSLDIGKEIEKEEERLKQQEELKKQEQAPKTPSAEELLESVEDESADEQEAAEEPAPEKTTESVQPDPSEEDINEIITKGIPTLPRRKTVWDRVLAYHVPFFLVLILILGVWSLTRIVDLPIIDQRAEQAVEKQLQVGIAQKINAEWEFLSQQEKARKAARLYAEARRTPEVKREIEQLTAKLKAYYQAPDQLSYFFGIDPYYYYAQVKEEEGVFATPVRLLQSMTGWSLERALFFVPVLVGLGSLIVLFFIVRLATGKSLPAVLASVVLAVHPVFMRGNAAGNPHIHPVAVLFSLLSILFFVFACTVKGKKRFFSLLAVIPSVWVTTRLISSPHMLIEQTVSLMRLIDHLGAFLSVFAFAAIVMLGYRLVKGKAGFLEGFVLVWALVALSVALWKPHFTLHALPAFLTLVAIAADSLAGHLQQMIDWFAEHPHVHLTQSAAGMVVGLILIGGIWTEARAATNVLPEMHDGIAETSRYIAINSDADAIITTGWDFGYLWQAAAERATTLDSGLLDSSRAWWLAQAFTTADEKLARNIIRFLDCGDDIGKERSLDAVNATCQPPEGFVIASQDMLLQLPLIDAIAHDSAEPNQDRVSNLVSCIARGQMARCGEYVVNLTSLETVNDGKHPASVHVYRETGRTVRDFDDATIPYAVILAETNGTFSSFVVDQELAESMFVRWFAGDTALRYFQPVFTVDEPDRVVIFSVAWNGRNLILQNIAPANTSTTQLSTLLAQSLKD